MPYTFHEFPHTRNYDSDLREMIGIVRDIEEYLGTIDDTITQLQEAIKDIDSMKNAIAALESATSDLPSIRNQIAELYVNDSIMVERIESLETWINTLENRFDLVYQYIDAQDHLISLRVEMYRITLQEQIDAIRARLSEIDTTSRNPWHYELGYVDLQKNVNLMYADLADEVPIARDYSELGLTAEEYASLELTAYEYAVRGRKHLHMYWVYSPVYGWKQEISNVLTSIVNAIFGTLSASDYSALDMTADEYASMDMTSEDYQRYNPTATSGYLRVSPSGNGLTKTQYEHIELVQEV